jgi:hypothetical protein
MSEWPNSKRLRIDSLNCCLIYTGMSDEAAPPPAPLCIDDLMHSALDVLELGLARARRGASTLFVSRKQLKKRSTIAIHQGSKHSLRESKRKFEIMMPPVPLRRLHRLRRLRPRLLQKLHYCQTWTATSDTIGRSHCPVMQVWDAARLWESMQNHRICSSIWSGQ